MFLHLLTLGQITLSYSNPSMAIEQNFKCACLLDLIKDEPFLVSLKEGPSMQLKP